MPNINPIINLRPTNPTIEKFLQIQKFGLQPYDRNPNDYLRFVAKIFTAWRDPEDNILNFDPFDNEYYINKNNTSGVSTDLQATADKSIVAYVDGFQTEYNFVRLVTDANSTDLTGIDTGNLPNVPQIDLTKFTDENGKIITIDKSKFGEYHRFKINSGICFIDNQLIQVTEDTEWWFRVPEVKDYNTDGTPNYELGQFIKDPLKVYSLLPNKNYKIILSYQYINQFESNAARLRFETDDTAIDEPYFLVASFSTDEFGILHQTIPINEFSTEKYKDYVIKEITNSSTGVKENRYYLKDINPQYLDKKYMVNHKNLFKHLKSQILTELSNSKISNVFHCKEITEEIDPSVSSGDFVYYDGLQQRWFPAEVSRQDFDRVHGLYLKNSKEGTNFIFTSGIIEITSDYSIIDSENQVLRNLIPGAEYFLADDTGTALDNAPFIDTFIITDNRESGYFNISTEVIAKASSITLTFKNSPDYTLPTFNITKTFNLDYKKGEQRVPQSINWEFSPSELVLVPVIKHSTSGQIQTEKLMFDIKLDMVQNSISETNEEIIEDFKLNTLGDIVIDVFEDQGLPSEIKHEIKIDDSELYLRTNNLSNVLLAKGPNGSPIMKLLDVFGTKTKKDYPALLNGSGLPLLTGEYFNGFGANINVYTIQNIKDEIQSIIDDLKPKLYNADFNELGLNDILALLGSEVTNIDHTVINLEQAVAVLEENYKNARLLFQSTESKIQKDITLAQDKYYISKNDYEIFNSNKFDVEQKKNAIIVRLSALNLEISTLNDAKNSLVTATLINIQDLIDDTQLIIDTLDSEIQSLMINEMTLRGNLVTLLFNLVTTTSIFGSFASPLFNYDIGYYNITNQNAVINFNDQARILPRMVKNAKNIVTAYNNVETIKLKLEASKLDYQNEVTSYTTNLLNGSMNIPQQLIALQNLNIKKATYDLDQADYNYYSNDLNDFRSVHSKLLPIFNNTKNLVKGELFTGITFNNGNNSSWGNSDLYTFTAKINSPLTHDVRFEFIYKEDTQDVMSIIIPAGQTESSSAVNIQMYPDSFVDAGVPKWIAYDGTTKFELFNLNAFNEMLMSDKAYLSNNVLDRNIPSLFTLDKVLMSNNPVTVKKPVQANPADYSKLKDISELDNLFNLAKDANDMIVSRDSSSIDLVVCQDQIKDKTNLKSYNIRYQAALQEQKDTGVNAVNAYDAQITSLNTLYNYYTTTTDIITDVPGTDKSLNILDAELIILTTQTSNAQTTMNQDKIDYDTQLLRLKTETDLALGEYVDGISSANDLIKIKKETKDKINVMFTLYKERTELVITIYDKLNSLVSSGLFNGEIIYTDAFILEKFQYQDAMENLLVEIVDDLVTLPMSSIIIPSILEYSCGTNGLQYPMDLQPWIFVKSSGKISTRKYPGATSVGIALNENTLILNIQHRPSGDISEFLNVYGNENDFNDQLISKYNVSSGLEIKTNLLTSINKVNTTIMETEALLVKNHTVKTRLVSGKNITITTSLSETELSAIDLLIQSLVTGTEGAEENSIDVKRKEFLFRIIYSKFYGSSDWYNPYEYLFGTNNSISSWFAVPGNVKLNNGKDPFNPEMTKVSPIDTFAEYIQTLFTDINGSTIGNLILKELFLNKLPLYKDLDIIEYILTVLPEPYIDYNAKFLTLKSKFQNIIKDSITLARYTLKDNPLEPLDDFENPGLTDEYISSASRIATVANHFAGLTANKTAVRNTYLNDIELLKTNHNEITKRISKFNIFKTYLVSLKEDIKVAIRLFENKLINLNGLKTEFATRLNLLDKEYLKYNSKMNKLPNVMWDIFRITNIQRTKWNYTYLALRIMGMQKELNNVVSGNSIQYSPINSELAELNILYNKALTNEDEVAAHTYQMQINGIEQKKTNFTNLLKNMVSEFNVIQLKYNKPTISSETKLIESYLVSELYMQNPEEYNLSYNFAPYPAYKEIL